MEISTALGISDPFLRCPKQGTVAVALSLWRLGRSKLYARKQLQTSTAIPYIYMQTYIHVRGEIKDSIASTLHECVHAPFSSALAAEEQCKHAPNIAHKHPPPHCDYAYGYVNIPELCT